MTVAAAATLVAGIILGYAGQRSRMCFVGAFRDLIAVGDRYRFKGFVAFVVTVWLLHPILSALVGASPGGSTPFGWGGLSGALILVTAAAGAVVGIASTLANGCPFRQHVLAAQGAVSSGWYLAGFYAGAFVYHLAVEPLLGGIV